MGYYQLGVRDFFDRKLVILVRKYYFDNTTKRNYADCNMKKVALLMVVVTFLALISSCSLIKPSPSKSIAALRKVQAATKTGVSRDRFLELVADSRLAVEDDCPVDTNDDPCKTLRLVQKFYDIDASLWTQGLSSSLEYSWPTTSNLLDKVK